MNQLPGFTCANCKTWNCFAADHKTCRVCDTPTPTVEGAGRLELITALRILSVSHDAMAETLRRCQERCTQMLDVARAAKRLVDARSQVCDANRLKLSLEESSGEDEPLFADELDHEVAKLRALEGRE
jgi:hypothetical protein